MRRVATVTDADFRAAVEAVLVALIRARDGDGKVLGPTLSLGAVETGVRDLMAAQVPQFELTVLP